MIKSRNLKGGIRSLFDPCVNATTRQPYFPSRMEVSYCTFGFGAICTHYHYRVFHRSITYLCDLSPRGKGNSRLMKLFGGLSDEKIQKYDNSICDGKMATTTDSPFIFLGLDEKKINAYIDPKEFQVTQLKKEYNRYQIAYYTSAPHTPHL